jgi:alanine dehydrogenase
MTVGTVREIKRHEYRVGLTPNCVKSYVNHGHRVLIETGAGEGAGFSDLEYIHEGGEIVLRPSDVFQQADMIVKVKEPQKEEYESLREDQILYTYLHLAADLPQTQGLLKSGTICIAYETMEAEDGTLPCLKPMSEIAGRLSIQEGAKYLEKTFGGRGVLLGGVPGVARGKVAILGGGVVGTNAAQIAMGMGADVTILDINSSRLEYLDHLYMGRLNTLYSTPSNIEKIACESDLIVGAVLVHGARAPHLLSREHLKIMKKGAVLVDVAIDQGGCIESSHPTTHDDPVFTMEEVVHYCVANMPGAVSRTSTLALTSTTLKYGLKIADTGVEQACLDSVLIRKGLNIYKGKCTFPDVAKAFDLPYTPVNEVI